VDTVACAPWLDRGRAYAWLRILTVVSVLGCIGWVGLSRNGLDSTGKPLGTDFVAFWSAARVLVDGGAATDIYDQGRNAAQQAAVFGPDVGYAVFPYPPIFLLICAPFGLLPYLLALAAWVSITGYAYVRALQGWLGRRSATTVAALAFPAVLINLAHGQTAFLATALFATGTGLLGRRDVLAGVCLGALAFKPHLGLLIPVALLAARNWRAFGGATLSAVSLATVSALVFGLDSWRTYPDLLAIMKALVESGALAPGKIQTVFAALRLWSAPLPIAYGGHAAVALAAAVAVGWFAWSRPKSTALGPVLVGGTLLMSPYMFDYDLVLCAIPLAWLLSEGTEHGFRRWEKMVMLATYVLPLVARLAAVQANFPLSPFVLTALFVIILRRAVCGSYSALEGPALARAPSS